MRRQGAGKEGDADAEKGKMFFLFHCGSKSTPLSLQPGCNYTETDVGWQQYKSIIRRTMRFSSAMRFTGLVDILGDEIAVMN